MILSDLAESLIKLTNNMVDINYIQTWAYKYLKYRFNNINLLVEALTHPSFEANNPKKIVKNYERLEFLGDTVLNLIVTEMLMQQFPHEKEGDLAKRRAQLVCCEMLAQVAETLNVPKALILSPHELEAGGNYNPNNLENCLEAIIGAIYIDSDLNSIKSFIKNNWEDCLVSMKEPPKDPKSALQEWAQKNNKPIPVYSIIDKNGLDHQPIFKIKVEIDNSFLPVIVEAKSRKIGERLAAIQALEQIKEQNG
ncbi:ribonuclease III [Rickettsiales endosymbiont of Stachyamoeba lipophora]|uniref:ribonuclease III n=1 Tax=Rickettsiales endosymbiont of Stachyamoeba lipophora TaxID=2486578 RepID=UPI000F64DCDB|nr:ribonuclease III [Rickettsiales endosymbiont of Stachyamoeba lipophora]AZL16428.1 ribonuclease III [Rickettsiales endosymbiont of Stachyamoeba lipophora]